MVNRSKCETTIWYYSSSSRETKSRWTGIFLSLFSIRLPGKIDASWNECIWKKEKPFLSHRHFWNYVHDIPGLVRRMHWEDMQLSVLPNIDFGKHMAHKRFEPILLCLQMSSNPNQDDQVLEFINAVNNVLKSVITPGNVEALDKNMIKSFHWNLKGKVKIIRKPWHEWC